MSFKKLALCVGIISLLAACASSGDLKMGDQKTSLKSSYESVKIVVNPIADDSQEVVPDVRSALAGQLLATGQFHRISNGAEQADLIVTVNISKCDKVSATSRVLLGALAGSNLIVADVSVTDGKTGMVLRKFEATGESASHPLSGEAEFSDALREFSRQVMLGISS